MPTYTTKLKLPKPLGTEFVTREHHDALIAAMEANAAAQADLDQHVNDKENPHETTYGQVGAAAENHRHPNATNTEDGFMSAEEHNKLTDIEAGAQVNDVTQEEFDSHVNNKQNPHGVTTKQTGAETPAGAQAKANASEEVAKQYTDNRLQYSIKNDLASIGVDDADLSATDFDANVEAILSAMGPHTILIFFANAPNISASIQNKLGLTIAGYHVEFMTTDNLNVPNIIRIYPNNTEDIYYLTFDNVIGTPKKYVFEDELEQLMAAFGGLSFNDIPISNAKQVWKPEQVDVDTKSAYNSTTGEYVIPSSGYYLISFSAEAEVTNAYNFYADVYINGVNYFQIIEANATGTGSHNASFTRIAQLNENDTLQIQVSKDDPDTTNLRRGYLAISKVAQ